MLIKMLVLNLSPIYIYKLITLSIYVCVYVKKKVLSTTTLTTLKNDETHEQISHGAHMPSFTSGIF